ncbi:endolytic transglycosylase MltG [Legionella impletisoli]|uniref:Endolytic murein transglycosylase n=1 Tax=Legionella impletisoli TaxID=343510 RepID=A0A917K0K2_9GAMM|nr:endolytic transglycosylase MltG [Legionella impletisoli]GGI91281.1 ABC transporter substrate-binding protein [Legionella impletisoli]
MIHQPMKLLFTLIAALSLALIIGLGFVSYRAASQHLLSKSQEPKIFQVKKNATAAALIESLKHQTNLHSDQILLLLIRIFGLTHQLKAGIYEIQPQESAWDFIHRVAQGDVLKISFTIVEGTTQKQVVENLKTAPYLSYKQSDWDVIKSDHPSDEGLLLADTYMYEAGTNAARLIAHAHTDLLQYLNERWEKRKTGLPYQSPYEMLIVASILEKETAVLEEKYIISGVIVNRIRKHMPLQVDPTVIYALGEQYDGKLTHKDMQFDSPFNTYKYRGLPPTPIAMVGRDAIDAAANPAQTNYLYFVAKGDGTHHFSASYKEQKEAIDRYLKSKK